MEKSQLITKLEVLLMEQKQLQTADQELLSKMDGILESLRKKSYIQDFEGTFSEIHAFTTTALDFNEREESNKYVESHRLNLSRWLEELSLLADGGGAVTIDYEQRKGREV